MTNGEVLVTYHTRPTNRDTDGDSVNDNIEIFLGTNPTSGTCYPGDGDIHQDGVVNIANVVLVTRFDSGTLIPRPRG